MFFIKCVLKILNYGEGEMVQWLSSLAGLTEDPEPHGSSQTSVTPVPGDLKSPPLLTSEVF